MDTCKIRNFNELRKISAGWSCEIVLVKRKDIMGNSKKIVVIGGGASGLMASIIAARNGADVTILEHKEKIGKKILATGNGRCNFTNAYMNRECFRGENIKGISSVLKRFGTKDTLDFFSTLGVLPKDRNGYYYPKSNQASAIVDVLNMELKRQNVEIVCDSHVTAITKRKQFKITSSTGNYVADSVILATGGKATTSLGSDGSGYSLAKVFGHTISPVVPALVQLHGNGNFFKQISGVRSDAQISLYVDEKLLGEDIGEIQFTDYGISGIPVFQMSRFAAIALYEKKTPKVILDFFPEFSKEALTNFFKNRIEQNNEKKAGEFLVGLVNKKLIPILLRASGVRERTLISEVEKERLERLIDKCKGFEIEITKTNSFEQAQVCAGGVRLNEIDLGTMESLYEKGLYITGELLDVDGICGGYNLQWAWTTGYIAGENAARGKKYD
ncbi:BaiN/RdsA family NAD(P)/FAD-dependent oxidoreductase [Faecalimonas sp.]